MSGGYWINCDGCGRLLFSSDRCGCSAELIDHVDNALGGCPVCGSYEVTGDAWDMETDVRRGVVSAWQSVSCDDCGSSWDDVYTLTGRENVLRGDRVEIATARQSVGVSDWLDMAYEDRTVCDDMGGML